MLGIGCLSGAGVGALAICPNGLRRLLFSTPASAQAITGEACE